jgi:hypothetical protein
MENSNQNDYLNEVTKEDVEGLYFVDYKETQPTAWVRIPYMTLNQVMFEQMSFRKRKIRQFRVLPLETLIEPVNEDGLTEEEFRLNACEEDQFVPVMQKVEAIFDSRYRITRDMMRYYLNSEEI